MTYRCPAIRLNVFKLPIPAHDRFQLREFTPQLAVASGDLRKEGRREAFGEFVAMLDAFAFWFNIVILNDTSRMVGASGGHE